MEILYVSSANTCPDQPSPGYYAIVYGGQSEIRQGGPFLTKDEALDWLDDFVWEEPE